MLSKRQNLMETIKGGHPDRFVNQFEFLELIIEAPLVTFPEKGETITNEWGITFSWPEDQLGEFPLHDDDHKVLKDITQWEKYVKAPSVEYSNEQWAPAIEHANSVDRQDKFVTAFILPGIFEMTHHLMGMEDALTSLYEEPECMHSLIEYLTDYQIRYAKQFIDRIKPDALYQHDDWGGQISSFFSPDMFKEFFLEPYRKIYGFWRENGVELIVHHSDSYAANLVPYMIDIGVDIWQGVMTTNNTPELIKKYGDQITFMGDIDTGVVDNIDWNVETINKNVEQACGRCGKLFFIPNLTQGMDLSSFPGVYETTSESIDIMSKKMF